jgi:hypothetical protein
MAEIVDTSRTLSRSAEPLSWLRRMLLGLARWRADRHDRGRRIDEQAWSDYMLRDIGLDESRTGRGRDPRALPIDWPLR